MKKFKKMIINIILIEIIIAVFVLICASIQNPEILRKFSLDFDTILIMLEIFVAGFFTLFILFMKYAYLEERNKDPNTIWQEEVRDNLDKYTEDMQNNASMPKVVLISDFDGTISKEDFFNMVIERLLKKEDIQPWHDYLADKITHVEALSRIFAKVRISQRELDSFIQSIAIDENLPETLELCKKLNIPIYICSAGMDYYILKRIPELITRYNITLVSNSSTYSPETGFKVTPPPPNDPFYSKEVGISKKALVESLKQQGFFTIFAGDGRPDIEAAKVADAVFARSVLLELCRKENIKTIKFYGFGDIIRYIGELYGIK